ncbi:MAG: type II secretion system protein J [Vulcanimicrobiota bacterium]
MCFSFSKRQGFTLAEMILAIAFAAVAILTLLVLCGSALRANQRTADSTLAETLARSEFERLRARVAGDEPAGCHDSFWNHTGPGPWTPPWNPSGQVRLDRTDFSLTIYAETVPDATTGFALGTGLTGVEHPDNRVKKVDLVISWMDGERQGYGRTTIHRSRLVCE